ncbi:MAG: FAD-dependent oxidoreductase, partial [Cellulosilyticaceae bacterium]
MGRKILIVGGVAGGASAAARLRRHSEADQIIMFEKGPHVSFSNCSLPYHLSGMIEDANRLVLMNPEKFITQYKIEARVNNEVVSIDRVAKEVEVKNTLTGEMYRESYDKLVLSPGAKPILPAFKGIENVHSFGIRNVVDIAKLREFIQENKVKRVAVVGGGYIGIEVAENLRVAGHEVTLIEAANQILRPFDEDMVQLFHKELYDHGIQVILSDKVSCFEKDTVILESGKRVEAEAVVLAIGVTPETELAVQAGIALGETRAIKV